MANSEEHAHVLKINNAQEEALISNCIWIIISKHNVMVHIFWLIYNQYNILLCKLKLTSCSPVLQDNDLI